MPKVLKLGDDTMSVSDALDALAALVSEICGNSERRTRVTLIAAPRRFISA